MAILHNFDENRKTKRFDGAVPAQVTSVEFSELVRVHDLSRGGCRISSEGSLCFDGANKFFVPLNPSVIFVEIKNLKGGVLVCQLR